MTYSFELGAFFGAILLLATTALAYNRQKKIEREHELTLRRRELYAKFAGSLVDAAIGDPTEHLRARVEATVIASDDVLKALAVYNEYAERTSPGGGEPRNGDKFRSVLSAVLIAMREDVFEKTSVQIEDYPSLLPIKAEK